MATESRSSHAARSASGPGPAVRMAIQVVVAVAVWGLLGALVDAFTPWASWFAFTGTFGGTWVGLVLVDRDAADAGDARDAETDATDTDGDAT